MPADTEYAHTLRDPSGRPIEINTPAGGDDFMVSPQAAAQAFQNAKIRDAEKAVAAAIQFQGIRGYQQALKSGEPAEKAMARYGPMMFYTRPSALGSAVRALTPPQLTPHQKFLQEQANRPQVRAIPGGGFVTINPTNFEVKTIREATEKTGKPEKFSAVASADVFGRPIRLPMNETQFKTFMETAEPELRTNAVNMAISRMITPPATLSATNAPVAQAQQYRTPEDVRAAFKSKSIDRDTAKRILTEQFGMK